MIKRLMLLSAALLAFHAAGADSPASASASETKKKDVDIHTAVREKTARVQTLTAQRNDLLGKQKQKRQELLKTNPKLRRMYLQILKQTRQLALELDANREIRQMNDKIHEIEKDLEKERIELKKLNEQNKLNQLKEKETSK